MSSFLNNYLLVGGAGIGLAIACLTIFFLNRFDKFNAQILGAVASVVTGGVVTTFLGFTEASPEGKQMAWVGYGLGLALVMFGAVMLGHLQLSRPSVNEDPRIVTLASLAAMYNRSQLTYEEYVKAKEAILADLARNPSQPVVPRGPDSSQGQPRTPA